MIKCLVIAFSILSIFANGMELKYFKYYKTASALTSNPKAISTITLDSEIYNKTLSLSSDLRVTDENNREIPFALKQVFLKNIHESQHASSSTIESLKKIRNTVVITVKQKNTIMPIDAILIKTPAKNFEKSVSIAGGNDNKSWKEIVSKKNIFDYSSIIALRKTTIKIPRSNYKYFRVSIHNFSEEKISPIYKLVKEKQSGIDLKEIKTFIKRETRLKIGTISLIRLSKFKTNLGTAKRNYPVKISNITTKEKKTNIELNSSSEPLSELSISSSSTNFSRELVLKGSNDKKSWRVITRKNWKKSNIFNEHPESNKISFSEQRYKFYRITIQNGDNPPLKNIKISARGNIYRIIMLGKQNLNLKLYYGGRATYPQYEIAGLLPAIMDFKEINYKLSTEKINPLFDNSPHPEQISYKWLFIVIIVLISIILILILYKNLGKLNSIEGTE